MDTAIVYSLAMIALKLVIIIGGGLWAYERYFRD